MVSKRLVLLSTAVAALWTTTASADTMTTFGVQYSSLGNATLSSNADGSVQVSNINSSSDGVQLSPVSGGAAWGQNFSLDTSINPGTVPVGGYIQQTAYGPISGGTAPVVSTLTATEEDTNGDVMLTGTFPDSPTGGAITIDYYSGGLDGTLVYQETTNGNSFGITVRKAGGDPLATTESDWNYYNWPNVCTTAYDTLAYFLSVTTASGATLPESDDIDFIHFIAPTNLAMDSLGDSNIDLTSGGGLSGFAITGEALAVPEPASILLALLALGGCAFACRRS